MEGWPPLFTTCLEEVFSETHIQDPAWFVPEEPVDSPIGPFGVYRQPQHVVGPNKNAGNCNAASPRSAGGSGPRRGQSLPGYITTFPMCMYTVITEVGEGG